MNNSKIKYTAFMDILGFSDYMKKHITNDVEAEEFYTKVDNNIINYFKYIKFNRDKFTTDEVFNNNIFIDYTWISDTFIITIEYDGSISSNDYKRNMIGILAIAISDMYHFFAKEYNLMLRGAISSKYTFINAKVILGEGITEASELDKQAIYPRVIFADDIITDEIIKFISSNNNDLNIITKDCDGYYFVNYIGTLKYNPPMINTENKTNGNYSEEKIQNDKIEILTRYIEIADNGLNHPVPSVKCKYEWLKSYIKRLLPNNEKSCNMFAYNLFSKDAQEKLKEQDTISIETNQ